MIIIHVFLLFTRITVSDYIFLRTTVYHVEWIFATDAATVLMLSYLLPIRWQNHTANPHSCTVVPVMNGHPRDQAKVSVYCRWPLVTGTDGQAGDAKYNTPCNTT